MILMLATVLILKRLTLRGRNTRHLQSLLKSFYASVRDLIAFTGQFYLSSAAKYANVLPNHRPK